MTKAQRLLKKYPCPGDGVMNGELVFRFVDTCGLPLEFVILKVQQAKMFIDWPTFAKVAVASGWSSRKIAATGQLVNRYYPRQWVERTFLGENVKENSNEMP